MQRASCVYGVVDGQAVIGRVPMRGEDEAGWERLSTVLVRALAASMRAVYGWTVALQGSRTLASCAR